MSVINKVLRDLDQRQTGADGAARQTGPGAWLTRGTVPLATLMPSAKRRTLSASWITGAVFLLAVAGVAVWYGFKTLPKANPVVQMMVPAAAPAQASLSASNPVVTMQVVATSASESLRAVAPESSMVKKVPTNQAVAVTPGVSNKTQSQAADALGKSSKKLEQVVPALKMGQGSGIATDAAGDTQFLRMDSTLMQVPVSANSNSQQGVAQRSTNETLAQVQSLWNSGAHAAATELLQQALVQVESSSAVAAPVTSQSALARVARELARLYLVEGQVSQALALLTRLEPQLAQIADLWAMRANAAQRLGQHAEAVKSYKQALILKPDEPRWMSGQAVSMAAQGQISAAGELAEKARAFGALRPEVATYLRQLGVTVRMD